MAPKANTASSTAVDASRVEQEKDRLKRQTKQGREGQYCRGASRQRVVTSRLTPIKAYLVAYNLVSAGLWLNILFLTISAVLRKPAAPLIQQAGTLSKLFGISSIPHSASYAANALARVSNNYSHGSLGWWTKVTQSLAVLEIVHSAVGWVRSPIATTAAQVFSRVWTVWGVVEAAPEASKVPLTMDRR
jgi:very-long-chain (3R)-3-hydroxyacyl-CoA dehydratase